MVLPSPLAALAWAQGDSDKLPVPVWLFAITVDFLIVKELAQGDANGEE